MKITSSIRWLAVVASVSIPCVVNAEPPAPSQVRPFTLTPWMSKFVAQDDRAYTTYNWARSESLGLPPDGPLSGSDSRVSQYIRNAAASYFFSLNGALYLGSDPVYWRGIGGEHFILVRLRLPQGMRWIDFNSHYDEPGYDVIPADARKALAEQGCQVEEGQSLEDLFRGEGFHVADQPECAKIIFNTVRELNVDGIKYRKSSANFEGCRTEKREEFALMLIRTDWIKTNDWAVFSRHMSNPELQSEQIQIERLFLLQKPNPEHSKYLPEGLKNRPWPELDVEARAADDVLLTQEILGCQK